MSAISIQYNAQYNLLWW